MLEYLGAESAGSLVLLPPDKDVNEPGNLRPLWEDALSERIRNLPRATLSSGAPKRMSLAGAQNILLVVYRDDALFEPVGSEPSTHILKPNHVSDDYPASLLNKSRTFKYRNATLQTLAAIVQYCRNRVLTRLSLYRWLLFNLLVANNDNHLKNLSFMVRQ